MHTASNLTTLLPFVTSIAFALLAWGAVFLHYVWPRMRAQPLHAAVRPILHLHLFRFVGLVFIVPGVVNPSLPLAFGAPAAYGDLVAMGLAWLALLAGSGRYARAALWAFNVWGMGDLLFAYYQGAVGVGIEPSWLGPAWFIPTVAVPCLLWTHLLTFALLFRTSRVETPVTFAAR